MLRRSLAALIVLSACAGAPAGDGPAPAWLVKLTGVYPEDVEARRLERQARFASGAPADPPDPTYKALADWLGITAEVRANRLRNGLDPDTGMRLAVVPVAR